MASIKTGTICWQRSHHFTTLHSKLFNKRCLFCRYTRYSVRRLATTARLHKDGSSGDEGSFRSRLQAALRRTKIEWKPIPVGLGIAFLGAVQFYRIREREKRRQAEEDEAEAHQEGEQGSIIPRKRKRIRPSGPW